MSWNAPQSEKGPVTVYPAFRFGNGRRVRDKATGLSGRIAWRYRGVDGRGNSESGESKPQDYYTLDRHGVAIFAENDLIPDGLSLENITSFFGRLLAPRGR